MKTSFGSAMTWTLGLLLSAATPQLLGSPMLFDRGLPVTNLNNGAGANRSNVSWADLEATNDPTTFYLNGDDFNLSAPGLYNIDTIRVWAVGGTGFSLWGGLQGGTMSLLSSIAVPPANPVVTYAGGSTYLGGSGTPYDIYQLDFTVNFLLHSGQTFQFFLDGDEEPWDPANPSLGYVDAFIHASNAARSGSTQEGADGIMLLLAPDRTTVTTWSSAGNGWDKVSDGNVQVFGNKVPESASTLLLSGLGLIALAMLRRRLA